MKRTNRRSSWNPLVLVIAAFVLSRIIAFVSGMRFDTQRLFEHPLLLDPALLQERLWESLWSLHFQMPLLNALAGILLQVSSDRFDLLGGTLFLGAGLCLAMSLYLLMKRLGVRPWLSAMLSALFTVSPACLLWEHGFHDAYLLASGLTLSALFLHRYLSDGRTRDGIAFFAVCALLGLTRNLFHPVWFLLAAGLVWQARPKARQRVLLAAAIPFLILFSVWFKNTALFGSWSGSTWDGWGFSRMTTFMLTDAERGAYIVDGRLTELAFFRPPPTEKVFDVYEGIAGAEPSAGVPALDLLHKSNGALNYNHREIIGISRLYGWDALTVLRSRPDVYWTGVRTAYARTCIPSHIHPFAEGNLRAIGGWGTVWDLVLLGRSEPAPAAGGETRPDAASPVLMVLLPLLLAGGGWLALRDRTPPFFPVLLFLGANIVLVTAGTTLFDAAENEGFRFVIDPFLLVLAGLLVEKGMNRLKVKSQKLKER